MTRTIPRLTWDLMAAMREERLVRLSRRFEQDPIRRYVLGVGPTMFVLALVSDHLWFDGYECFRINDIQAINSDPYSAFAEAALRKRGEHKPRQTPVSVTSVADLLRSAAATFPLVTIAIEEVEPDICFIGRVSAVTSEHVLLQGIRPDATWETDPEAHQLSDITRVCLGGDYENALYLVGGEPPSN